MGLLRAVESLSSHRLLDRLIRGRMWIGLVAFALIGIVTLQLGLLKLNSGIGRAIERSAKLQTENAALSIENSELASGDRVEAQAERLGMKLVPIDGLHFLSSHARGDVAHAAVALRKPVEPSSVKVATEASGESEGSQSTAESSSSEHEASEAETSPSSSSESATSSEGTTSTPSESPSSSAGEPESSSSAAPTSSVTAEADGGTASPTG